MVVRVLNLAAFLVLVAPVAVADDAPAGQAEVKKELRLLQGTWQMESFKDAKNTKVDPKRRTLFFGSNTALVRDGDRVVQLALVNLALGKTPRRMDLLVKKGENEDTTVLGIYELKGDTLKVCFDPEGDSRPTSFEAKAGTSHFVAVYKRANPSKDEIDIVGKYASTSEPAAPAGVTVEIDKLGDGYQVTWSLPGGVAYTGIGLRSGDVLSVTWGNRGSVGLSVYKISKGPKLSGQYTTLGGPGLTAKEELTPARAKGPKADAEE